MILRMRASTRRFAVHSLLLLLGSLQARLGSAAVESVTLRHTPSGDMAGIAAEHSALAWKGIRYAEAPVGEFRWRAPRPAKGWQGVLDASRAGAVCSQVDDASGADLTSLGSEDCLFLNVYSPTFKPAEIPTGAGRLPVIVWLHPGANVARSGSAYDGAKLAASRNLIVVTLNFRLGVFGWFMHPALAGPDATPEDRSGNFALLDQIEALRWVKANIAAFGGDAARVTLVGESAGGWNTFALLASRQATGLFQRAVIQSGNLPFYTVSQATNYADDRDPGVIKSSSELLGQLLLDDGIVADRVAIKAHVAATPRTEIEAFLRAKSYADFLRAERSLFARFAASGRPVGQQRYLPGLFRDGVVIPRESFAVLAARGQVNRVPLILGTNRDEDMVGLAMYNPHFTDKLGTGYFRRREPEKFDVAIEYLGRLWKADSVDGPARALSKYQPVYAYRFDWDEQERTPTLRFADTTVRSTHEINVPFIFGTPNIPLPADAQRSFDALSDAMMDYWAAFARDGNPGKGATNTRLPWQEWNGAPGGGRFLVFDSSADGGIRHATGIESIDSVLRAMRGDRRMPSLESRCQMYYELVGHAFGANAQMGRLTPADYARAERGACASRFPLASRGLDQPVTQIGSEFRDCAQCPRMRVIARATFQMGGADSAPDTSADERPVHEVTLAKDFAVGTYEVTRGEFARFLAATGYDTGVACNDYTSGKWTETIGVTWRTPGFTQKDDHPVVCVSWLDAQAYVNWLSKLTGLRYRLPSEAEWEYLASVDGIRRFTHELANHGRGKCCGGSTEGKDIWDYTAPVGSFAANPFGVFDLHGNVWEWLQDCYVAGYRGAPADGTPRLSNCSYDHKRSTRGGSWGDAAAMLRSTYRLRGVETGRYFTLGFRVARDLRNE